MEKYVAYRIDESNIENGVVVKGFFVRGQRSSDFNWPLLEKFDSIELAKQYIKSVLNPSKNQIVYDCGGYEMKI